MAFVLRKKYNKSISQNRYPKAANSHTLSRATHSASRLAARSRAEAERPRRAPTRRSLPGLRLLLPPAPRGYLAAAALAGGLGAALRSVTQLGGRAGR